MRERTFALHAHPQYSDACSAVLNEEWPRNATAAARVTGRFGQDPFRPEKNMDVSAKSMDDSAKNDERFGQKRWTFRPNIYLIVLQRQMIHTIENSHLDILHVVCYDDGIKQSCRRQASILQRNVGISSFWPNRP